jgi:hypothetical protein
LATNSAQVLVRPAKNPKTILNVQDLNENGSYIAADYKLEILTTPETYFDTTVLAFSDNNISIPNYGTLSLMTEEKLLASIFRQKNRVLDLVDRFEINSKTDNRKLQPGEYIIVYKSKNSYDSESTRTQSFVIEDGRVVVINLQQ